MNKENSLDLKNLFFFVFGIESDSNEKVKKKKCAEKAYLDLCRTIKYRYKLGEAKAHEQFRKAKDDLKTRINNTITKAIDDYCDNCESFEAWHEKLYNTIVKMDMTFDDNGKKESLFDEKLTVGHIQKWINMTIKYEWIMGILNEKMLIVKNNIHIPLDNYIIVAASKPKVMNIVDGYSIKGLDIKKPEWTWSVLDDYDIYKDYQDNIREAIKDMSPIDWESQAWRAEALSRDNG